jgi:hypothetical protein
MKQRGGQQRAYSELKWSARAVIARRLLWWGRLLRRGKLLHSPSIARFSCSTATEEFCARHDNSAGKFAAGWGAPHPQQGRQMRALPLPQRQPLAAVAVVSGASVT